MKHKITISGIIGWDVVAQDIKDQFKDFKPNDEIEIEVNSPGGSVFEGIEISNAIKSHAGQTTTIATSLTASMGSYIMMAGNTKKAFDDATFMIHNASTIGIGDHRALRKTANVLESLTNVLSKAYVEQTGKEKSEIRDLMDDETWLFGDEILNAGFVDEIIKTEKPESKEEALAFQKLVFEDCNKKLLKDEENERDLDKLAAYFKSESTTSGGKLAASTPQPKQPETPNKEKNMTLAEFLALPENAQARVEYNNLLATAKTESANEAKEALKEVSAKVGPIIMSSDYGKAVKNAGLKVLSGEKTYSSFEDLVALSDEFKEKTNSQDIKDEQPEATPADGGPEASQDDKAKIKAAADETRKKLGV